MRRLPRLLVPGLLLAVLAYGETAPPAGWIPSRMLRQGHVQGVKDHHGTRLEILLHSRFMDRVINSIISKEQTNWGLDHPDASAYLETLKAVRERIRQPEGRESMLIVWDLADEAGEVRWYGGTVDENVSPWRMTEPLLLTNLNVAHAYLLRNAALILEDSLDLSPEAIADFLPTP